jgi:hypothetical protein
MRFGRFTPFTLTVVLAIAATLVAPTASAQLNQPLHPDGWILAAAHAPGLHGSIWRTDLWLYAGYLSGQNVTLTLCRSGQDNTAAQTFTVTTAPGQYVISIADVVDHFLAVGGGSWVGAIHYTADIPLQAWARVYSISADGSASYGQLVEGIPTEQMSPSWRDGFPTNHMQYVYAARHTADGRFRVNVGVVNPTASECDYRVEMFDATRNNPSSGPASIYVTVPAYSMVQLSDPFAFVTGGEWSDHLIQLLCDTSGGGGFMYASAVDNATNDAYFVRGVKDLSAASGAGLNAPLHHDGWLLAAARAPGLHGSIWRTDLWISMPGPSTTVNLTFCRSGEDNSGAQTFEVVPDPNHHGIYIEDVVETYLHVGDEPWVGAIHYSSSSELQVWARIYSISADGSASYGQLLEGIPTSDMSMAYDTPGYPGTFEDQWMFAGKHTANGRYRVNVGIINPKAVGGRFWVSMFDKFGQTDSRVELQLDPFSMVQLTDPFASVDGGDWSEKQIRVEAESEGTGAFGYISVVDNATNDAYFVRGIKTMEFPAP